MGIYRIVTKKIFRDDQVRDSVVSIQGSGYKRRTFLGRPPVEVNERRIP